MNKRNKIGILFCCLLLVVVAGASLWSANSTFGADSPQEKSIYFEGKKLSEKGYVINNTPYAPVEVVKKYGDLSELTIDTLEEKISIDLSRQSIIMADDVTTSFVKTYGGTVSIPLTKIDGKLYVPMNASEQFLKLSAILSNEGLKLFDYAGTDQIARVNENDVYMVPPFAAAGKREPVALSKGEMVFLSDETDNYYKIETQDGDAGYVMRSSIAISDIDLSTVDFYAPKQDKYIQGDEKINLVWHYVYNTTPTPPAIKAKGIDVLSPTWFDLIVNGGGEVENKGDLGYTRAAHDRGYMVWATITNSMGIKGSTAFTTSVFNNTALLNKTVAQYLFYACLYEADGINIDFEQVVDSDAAGLTAFTALLRTYTERQGLVLSIDTLIPKPWTIEYDRDALAKHVDYVAVMAYDEHYTGSPVAGSIASLPWVEEAVRETLKEVPKDKILMGVPMYTRVWVVDGSGKIIRNPSATMPYIENLIAEKKILPTWLSEEKQYFISYPNGLYTEKIWIEDSRSIANRLNLVQTYDLAGSACWQYSQASDEIWSVFGGMLKDGKTLNDYE